MMYFTIIHIPALSAVSAPRVLQFDTSKIGTAYLHTGSDNLKNDYFCASVVALFVRLAIGKKAFQERGTALLTLFFF